MIELRWLIFEGGHKVLQSRERVREVVSYMANGEPTDVTQHTWTDWTDIPQHLCAIINGERKVVERKL